MAAEGDDAPLKTVICALGQKRSGLEQHYSSSWTVGTPWRCRCSGGVFPQVPWIFLYRDPAEVLMSQSACANPDGPGLLPPAWLGIDAAGPVTTGRVLRPVAGGDLRRPLSGNFSLSGDCWWNYRRCRTRWSRHPARTFWRRLRRKASDRQVAGARHCLTP